MVHFIHFTTHHSTFTTSTYYTPTTTTHSGMALGDALQENKVLRTLNVANNSIDSVACLTICAGVLENEVS